MVKTKVECVMVDDDALFIIGEKYDVEIFESKDVNIYIPDQDFPWYAEFVTENSIQLLGTGTYFKWE